MSKQCPACGNLIENDAAKFCFKCGYSFLEKKTREEIDQEVKIQQEKSPDEREKERKREEAERIEKEARWAEIARQKEEAARRAEEKRQEELARRAKEAEQEAKNAMSDISWGNNSQSAFEEPKPYQEKKTEPYESDNFDEPKDSWSDEDESDEQKPKIAPQGGSGGPEGPLGNKLPLIIAAAVSVVLIIAAVIFFLQKNKNNDPLSNQMTASSEAVETSQAAANEKENSGAKEPNPSDVLGDAVPTTDVTTEATTEATTEWRPNLEFVQDEDRFLSDSEAIDLDDRIRALRQDYEMEILAIILNDTDMDKDSCKRYLQECCSNEIATSGFVFLLNSANSFYSIGYTTGFELDKNHISEFYDVVGKNLDEGKKKDAIYQGIKFVLENHLAALEPNSAANREGIHRYEIIVSDKSWTAAKSDAEARGGHLVTFETDEEFKHVVNLISQSGNSKVDQYWVGGTRTKENKTYYWCYENGEFGTDPLNQNEKYNAYWLSGEPSFRDESVNADEQYMDILNMGSEGWKWNDAPDDLIQYVSYFSGKIGYIVEYEK